MFCASGRLGIRISFCLAALLSCLFFFSTRNLSAQSPSQQFVYANIPGTPPASSTIAAAAKNGQTGALSSSSAFNERFEGGRLAVDALGRFLFVLNPTSNGISMFQIDSSTGALTEVPTSPFSSGFTINPNQAPSMPASLATEKSGKYLYVGYTSGNVSSFSAITPFVIDAANLRLALTDQLSFDVGYNPLQMFSDPRGLFLYVLNGANPFNGSLNGGASVYSIISTDGSLALNGTAGGGSESHCMAADPLGRFFYEGTGQFQGSIFWGTVSPLDGTSQPNQQFLSLGENNFPIVMFVDSSGKFLYAQQNAGLVIYAIDQTTGQPTPLNAPLPDPVFQLGNVVADPAGTFIYAGSPNGIRVFQVNAQNGALTEISGSPFPVGGAAANVGISGTSSQAITGPSAAFTPLSLNFGSVTQGQPATLVLHLVNNGDQSLTLNLAATSITGANAKDFSQSTTCTAALAANANCSFSVTFSPVTAAQESAVLNISDNAPGSPQSISLSGVGVAPTPSLAFSPGSLTFNPIAQGTAETPQSIQITNIGAATLHISSIALGGANPGDFLASNNCVNTAIAVNASCSITVTFTPQATGARSASLTLTDDAPNSPQTVVVQGTGATAFQLSPSPQSTLNASITAGQTAHYNLQLTPGAGFNGNVAIACTGAPTAATCSLSPTTLAVSSSNPLSFSANIKTTGATPGAAPFARTPASPWRPSPSPLTALFVLLPLFLFRKRPLLSRARLIYALLFICVCEVGLAGCGGGYSSPAPPPPAPLVTPKGNYVITVSATAGNLPPQSISLSLTVN